MLHAYKDVAIDRQCLLTKGKEPGLSVVIPNVQNGYLKTDYGYLETFVYFLRLWCLVI